ncbi:hypothetical protein [Pedobacter sp. SYSU D00535]|uniref:hypothetical protein n=1 Tax=Pedobacter sp. SYSU D00535 TaxID=2810308 RepID=UPI001A96C7A0|nr:hypothetical protein [Pedobacter sp. SYSU D00535]
MKRLFFTILTALIFSIPALAQQGKQLEAVKVGYITNKLDLSAEEAQRFWPVYHNYEREMREVIKQRNKERKSGATVDELKYETQILNIRKKYKKEFSEVLPASKVALVFQAERDFREQLIKELRGRRN